MNKQWIRICEDGGLSGVEFFLEVEGDVVQRQIERYGECWVYSGDTESYCPRESIDGIDAFGSLSENPFSEICEDFAFENISEQAFEQAWNTAVQKARHRNSDGLKDIAS